MNTLLHKAGLACLVFLALASKVQAQNVPITFEPAGFGSSWTWNTFENGPNTPIQIVANPNATGVNTSAYVARVTALQIGMPWAGFESIHPGSIPAGPSALGTFTLNATNSTVKIMVYKSVISDVGIKFATAGNASTGEIKVANTLINQWEELTFNFAGKIGEPSSTGIDQIVIFPDFQTSPTRSSDNVCYIDNITFSPTIAPPSGPTVAAPTPTRPASNVISLYSNAYTNVPVNTWLTGWSSGLLSDILVAGNDTKKYSNLNFIGAEFTGANLINASGMAYFHLDAWTPNITAFRIKLVDFGANAVAGGGDDQESELSFTPTLSGWNSYEIALSDFTTLINKSHLGQLILSGDPSGTGTVYVDNIYFHNVSNVPLVAAPTPTSPPSSVISMYSNAYTNVGVDTWHTSWSSATLTDLFVAGNATKRYSLLDYVGIEATGANLINASAMTSFNVSMWTPNITAFRIKLVDFGANAIYGGGDDVEHELSFTPILSGWNNYHIPLTAFTNLTTRSHIAQLIFSGNPTGLGTAYIDNVYFSNSAIALPLTLINFSAKMKNHDAIINWKTSNEVNVKQFDIERSNDGKQFITITSVESAVLKMNENNYSITDYDVANDVYYRLKMIDIDGQFTYSEVVKLNYTSSSEITLFPNPVIDELTISCNNLSLLKSDLTIYNAFGMQVKNIQMNGLNTKINLQDLSKGIYFLHTKTGSIISFTKY